MNGFLCINKTKGLTSRDVVNKILRHLPGRRVGHAGTLDPMATGVLVVAIGRATKLVQYVQTMSKQYRATFELGKTSDTEDVTGVISEHSVSKFPNSSDVETAIESFVGEIIQRPPAYSALRINGKRAYDLARKGEQFELASRPITVHSIDIVSYEYPTLTLDVTCGSGTYIRSLGRDIGEHLGCGALMSALSRTAIGGFRLDEARFVEDFHDADEIEFRLRPLEDGIGTLPKVVLNDVELKAVSLGQKIPISSEFDQLAAMSAEGTIAAILARSSGDLFKPAKNFVAD